MCKASRYNVKTTKANVGVGRTLWQRVPFSFLIESVDYTILKLLQLCVVHLDLSKPLTKFLLIFSFEIQRNLNLQLVDFSWLSKYTQIEPIYEIIVINQRLINKISLIDSPLLMLNNTLNICISNLHEDSSIGLRVCS